jgi:hypothetical protein
VCVHHTLLSEPDATENASKVHSPQIGDPLIGQVLKATGLPGSGGCPV